MPTKRAPEAPDHDIAAPARLPMPEPKIPAEASVTGPDGPIVELSTPLRPDGRIRRVGVALLAGESLVAVRVEPGRQVYRTDRGRELAVDTAGGVTVGEAV